MDQTTPTPEDMVILSVLKTFITPIVVSLVGLIIGRYINSIYSTLKAAEVKREKTIELMDIKIDAMAYAMGRAVGVSGEIFQKEYALRKKELLREKDWIEPREKD